MPYGYYQLVRFVGFVGFVFLARQTHQIGRQTETLIYSALALLFQPFFKIVLGRLFWNLVDIIVGLGLLVSIWLELKRPKQS